MIMWLRKTPSNVAPIPTSAFRDRSFRDVRLELDPVGAERLERVGQLEQLRLAIGARPLEGRPDPRPADLEPAMLGHDRQEAAAADGPAGRPIDRRERPLRAGLRVGQGRLDPASRPASSCGPMIVQRQSGGSKATSAQVREVVARSGSRRTREPSRTTGSTHVCAGTERW